MATRSPPSDQKMSCSCTQPSHGYGIRGGAGGVRERGERGVEKHREERHRADKKEQIQAGWKREKEHRAALNRTDM